MNKNVMSVMAAILLVPAMAGADGWSTVFDGGWRISAGAVYDSGVKTRMRFSPRQVYGSPYLATPGSLSRRQAEKAGLGATDGSKTSYVNMRQAGVGSWVDTNDPATGHDSGLTEIYRFPSDVWDRGTMFELGYATWEEGSSWQNSFDAMESLVRDDSSMPGISVELSRNLYHDEEYGWGIDAAFAFQYFRRDDAFRAGSDWAIGSSSRSSGGYSSRYNATGDLAELLTYSGEGAEYIHDYLWYHEDGEYIGTGGDPEADATPIDASDIKSAQWEDPSHSGSEFGALDAEGDYESLELMLLARPYYDVLDWLRVNAMLGLVVSRQSMEMSFTMLRNGAVDYHSRHDFSQWDVYGVAGLGLMLYWRDFTLAGDFMARFLDRDMDISDLHYSGRVSRGDWLFRLTVGYEF